jgi:hypothetical protein
MRSSKDKKYERLTILREKKKVKLHFHTRKAKHFRFMDLPCELQDIIISKYLTEYDREEGLRYLPQYLHLSKWTTSGIGGHPICLGGYYAPPPLSQTCKQLRHQVLDAYLGECYWILPYLSKSRFELFTEWLEMLGDGNMKYFRMFICDKTPLFDGDYAYLYFKFSKNPEHDRGYVCSRTSTRDYDIAVMGTLKLMDQIRVQRARGALTVDGLTRCTKEIGRLLL